MERGNFSTSPVTAFRWGRTPRSAAHRAGDYDDALIFVGWLIASVFLSVLAGILVDATFGHEYVYRWAIGHVLRTPPDLQDAWQARMLVAVCFPSFILTALGPLALRCVRLPWVTYVTLGCGMALATLMVYSQSWQDVFCSHRIASCRPSGLPMLDTIGSLDIGRIAPSLLYTERDTVAALLALMLLLLALVLSPFAMPAHRRRGASVPYGEPEAEVDAFDLQSVSLADDTDYSRFTARMDLLSAPDE